MTFNEKLEFLGNAQDLAYRLENVTDRFIEIQIGWITTPHGDQPLTIMVNHECRWFGDFNPRAWSEIVVWNNINNFTPVKDPYLVLNELITQAYRGAK